MDDSTLARTSRTFAANLEPCVGQVYFAPECHTAYVALGFGPSSGAFKGVAMPDPAAYFTSRGSLLGQAEPHVVAAAFGVFNPDVVVPAVRTGWQRTDASTIFATRRRGAVAQLRRVLGDDPDGMREVVHALEQMVEPLRPEGRPLFAGTLDWWDDPADLMTRFFHLGDMLREYRGDCHINAWTSAGIDATEIGMLTEWYMGLPSRTYVRTRAWDDAALDAAEARLTERGWVDAGGLTASGREEREAVERATDRQLRAAMAALGDATGMVCGRLEIWGKRVRDAGGYPGGAADLWPNRG
jgi:Helix-turn-helix family